MVFKMIPPNVNVLLILKSFLLNSNFSWDKVAYQFKERNTTPVNWGHFIYNSPRLKRFELTKGRYL